MQKVLVTIKTMIKNVMKKEPVLSIAVILAVISMFVVHPDDTYASYIDFRTLAILFCLMVIVAGMREIGVFDYIAQSLLNRVKSISGIVMILVLLCFFLSMVITNDVALITFVPFAILILKRFPKEVPLADSLCSYADSSSQFGKHDDTYWKSSELISLWKSKFAGIIIFFADASVYSIVAVNSDYMDCNSYKKKDR